MRRSGRIPTAALVVGALALVSAVLVAQTLRRPELPTFAPSPVFPREDGGELVGPLVYTIDASAPDRWRFFSFAQGSVVEGPGPLGWDLAFRRSNIIVNGGEGFAGSGGAQELGRVDLAEVPRLPEGGYLETRVRRDSVHAALERWYDYGFTTHLLRPRPVVYALRTADGRYAAFEILSYYCPGALPGCVTIRYLYQGAGGPVLVN